MDRSMYALLVAGFVACVNAYPQGPPTSVCATMIPGHDVQAQSMGSIEIHITESDTYWDNNTIQVQIKDTAKGFMVQARRKDNNKPVGYFTALSNNAKTLSCDGGDRNTWVHSENSDKMNPHAKWNPPTYSAGKIYFVATVVKSKPIFWVDQRTAELSPRANYPVSGAERNHCLGIVSTILTAFILWKITS